MNRCTSPGGYELFTKLDAGVAALQKAKALLKHYRQSVLKAAVEGKLTEEWRRENGSLPAPRPGKFYVYVIKCSNGSNYIGQTNDLPKRYREHKEGRGADWTRKYPPQYVMYWEELDSRKAAVEREKWLKTGFGRKWIKRFEKAGRTWNAGEIEPASVLLERIQAERKERLGKKYKPPKPIDTTNLPELPDGWVWASLGEVTKQSKIKISPQNIEKTIYIGLEHIDKDNGKIIGHGYSDEIRSTKSVFKKGDLLYGKLRPYLNKVWLATFDGICSTDLIVLSKSKINNGYLKYRLLMPDFVCYANLNVSGVHHPRVKYEAISRFTIPIPPKKEQDIIVREVSRLILFIDESEQIIDAELKRSQSLRQSILKRAFEGKLVPQDPSDPPASVLLERIKSIRQN